MRSDFGDSGVSPRTSLLATNTPFPTGTPWELVVGVSALMAYLSCPWLVPWDEKLQGVDHVARKRDAVLIRRAVVSTSRVLLQHVKTLLCAETFPRGIYARRECLRDLWRWGVLVSLGGRVVPGDGAVFWWWGDVAVDGDTWSVENEQNARNALVSCLWVFIDEVSTQDVLSAAFAMGVVSLLVSGSSLFVDSRRITSLSIFNRAEIACGVCGDDVEVEVVLSRLRDIVRRVSPRGAILRGGDTVEVVDFQGVVCRLVVVPPQLVSGSSGVVDVQVEDCFLEHVLVGDCKLEGVKDTYRTDEDTGGTNEDNECNGDVRDFVRKRKLDFVGTGALPDNSVQCGSNDATEVGLHSMLCSPEVPPLKERVPNTLEDKTRQKHNLTVPPFSCAINRARVDMGNEGGTLMCSRSMFGGGVKKSVHGFLSWVMGWKSLD